MNRGYTAGQYRDFIARARGYMPDICIASDFIVGFPTETDEEFDADGAACSRLPIQEQLHLQIFPAPRNDRDRSLRGRRARGRQAPPKQRAARGAAAGLGRIESRDDRQDGRSLRRRRKQTGQSPSRQSKVELGWESRRAGFSPHVQTQLVGRTRGDQVVCFDGNLSLKGEILNVQITAAQNLTLFGVNAEPQRPKATEKTLV